MGIIKIGENVINGRINVFVVGFGSYFIYEIGYFCFVFVKIIKMLFYLWNNKWFVY